MTKRAPATVLRLWLNNKWRSIDQQELFEAYRVTFGTVYGQVVLQDLLNKIYCQVYEGTDPQGAVIQNAKRGVVHDILYNIELATGKPKSIHTIIDEGSDHGRERRPAKSTGD